MEKFTLLGSQNGGTVGKTLRDDLLLNRFFRRLPLTATELSVLFETLSEPPLSVDDIRLRQGVMEVFAERPSMLTDLSKLADKFGLIRQNWDAERAKLFTLRHLHTGDKNAEFYSARMSLQLSARYLKLTLLSLGEIVTLLDRYKLEKPCAGISALRAECAKASEGKEYRAIYEFADKIELGILEASSYDVQAVTDDELRASGWVLADFRFTPLTEQARKAEREERLFPFFRKKKNDTPTVTIAPVQISAYLSDITSETSYDILLEAVAETDRLMIHTARSLLTKFGALPKELAFYRAGLLYCQRMTERGIALIYPTVCPENEARLELHGVRDLILLSEATKPSAVVANDCILNEHGSMLIRGENSSGKTVFLRSVGIAVLLGLSGLPICAESGTLSVRRGLFSLFASAEKTEENLPSAGRFETEVAALAEVVHALTPSSLVLLNETFQSTAYAEGAEGILPVLDYIAETGGNVLFVTHLTELFTELKDRPAVTLCTSSQDAKTKYKILPIKEL